MQIMMVSEFYPPIMGGGVMHVQSLSRELAKRGHQVTVCTVGRGDLPGYQERDGVKLYRVQGFFQRIPLIYKEPMVRFHPPTRDWIIARKLARIIREQKPDIIHAFGWMLYSLLPLKRNLKLPVVVTLNGYGFICPKASLLTNSNTVCEEPFTRNCILCAKAFYGLTKSWAAYHGTKTNKSKLKSVDKFIAVSTFVKEVHLKHLGLDDKDIVVIPSVYSPDVEGQEEGLVDFPQDFILFVGAASPHKGVNVLIEAYQRLNTRVKLVLIGYTHPDYCYQSAGDVLMIENAPHNVVMRAMARCSFAVFPSVWPEPCPRVAIEAMSQKKAVIASNIGGLKDIVVDGETGILVPPNNPDELSEAISYLLQEPEIASQMGNRGYERFMENYTPDAVIPKVIEVYDSLI